MKHRDTPTKIQLIRLYIQTSIIAKAKFSFWTDTNPRELHQEELHVWTWPCGVLTRLDALVACVLLRRTIGLRPSTLNVTTHMLQLLLFLGLRQEHNVLSKCGCWNTTCATLQKLNSVSVPAVWRKSSLTVATCSNHLAPLTSHRFVSFFADYWRLRITKHTPDM